MDGLLAMLRPTQLLYQLFPSHYVPLYPHKTPHVHTQIYHIKLVRKDKKTKTKRGCPGYLVLPLAVSADQNPNRTAELGRPTYTHVAWKHQVQ